MTDTYSSGETPLVDDIVRFSGWYWTWWLTDRQRLIVLSVGKFDTGRTSIQVGWLDDKTLRVVSRILTNWNPANFVLMDRL